MWHQNLEIFGGEEEMREWKRKWETREEDCTSNTIEINSICCMDDRNVSILQFLCVKFYYSSWEYETSQMCNVVNGDILMTSLRRGMQLMHSLSSIFNSVLFDAL